jgi:diguanylate cyclase
MANDAWYKSFDERDAILPRTARSAEVMNTASLKRRMNPRFRILIWASIIGMLVGLTGFAEPLDDIARSQTYAARAKSADGEIVVVGIDEKSIAATSKKWPWSTQYDAQLIDRLTALGARRIIFDRAMVDEHEQNDDAQLIAALKRAPNKVYFGTHILFNGSKPTGEILMPAEKFRPYVRLTNFNVWRNTIGQTALLPYSQMIEGRQVSSIANTLAKKSGQEGGWFRPDFSIDYRTISQISARDVLNNKATKSAVFGKDVLIGMTSASLGDMHWIPGQGQMPGVFIHAIGAQTLKNGKPIQLGWLPWFAFGIIAACIHLLARTDWKYLATLSATITGFVVLPIGLEAQLVSSDIMPGVFAFSFAAMRLGHFKYTQKRSTTNLISGLANLNALRQSEAMTNKPLIAAKVTNYAETISSFSSDIEKTFVAEIARRLTLNDAAVTVYQGDEGSFFIQPDTASREETYDHVDGLHALFSSPIRIGDRNIDVRIAFGLDHETSRSLTARINSAIMSAEDATREGIKAKTYASERLDDADWRLSLLGRLDNAIDDGEVWIAYQPKYDPRTQEVIGAEALARWTHPTRGEVSPDEFVLAAEQQNRISKLTAFVFDEALRAATAFRKLNPKFGIAINLSAGLLEDKTIVTKIAAALNKNHLSPRALTLEITESREIIEKVTSIETLKKFRQMGINVSIDDYGTGFSTLDYLLKLPANEVKIDKSFTAGIKSTGREKILVASTIKLAHELGCKVVAEGVENLQTLAILRELNCDVVQGYLLGRPAPFADFLDTMSEPSNRVQRNVG